MSTKQLQAVCWTYVLWAECVSPTQSGWTNTTVQLEPLSIQDCRQLVMNS